MGACRNQSTSALRPSPVAYTGTIRSRIYKYEPKAARIVRRIKRYQARRLTDPSKCSGFLGSRTTRVARGSQVSQFVRLGVQPPRLCWKGISVHPVPRQFRWNCRETGFQTNNDSYNFYRVIVSTRNEVLTISLYGEAPDEGGTTKE